MDALRASKASLRRAQALAKITHVISGADGAFESWLDTLPDMLGLGADAMPKSAREWLALVHPQDRDMFRQHALQAAHESDRRFNDMLDKVEMISLMLDCEGRITYCNDYLLRLTGWEREEIAGRNWFDMFVPPEMGNVRSVFADVLADRPSAWHYDNEILTRSGERRLVHWNNTVLRSVGGQVTGVAALGEDITERREAERKIKRLNRVYAMLSGINTLIVRVRDREELFREACRIAVEHGHFRIAWIGRVDRAAQQVVPVGLSGVEADFVHNIRDRLGLFDVP